MGTIQVFFAAPAWRGAGIRSQSKIWFYAAESWEAQSCLSDLRGSSGRRDWEIREHTMLHGGGTRRMGHVGAFLVFASSMLFRTAATRRWPDQAGPASRGGWYCIRRS